MINFTIQSNYGIRHLNPNIQASNIEIFPSPENTGAPPASPRIKCQYPIKNRHVSNQAPQQTPKKKIWRLLALQQSMILREKSLNWPKVNNNPVAEVVFKYRISVISILIFFFLNVNWRDQEQFAGGWGRHGIWLSGDPSAGRIQ